jgi:hypothetical protein
MKKKGLVLLIFLTIIITTLFQFSKSTEIIPTKKASLLFSRGDKQIVVKADKERRNEAERSSKAKRQLPNFITVFLNFGRSLLTSITEAIIGAVGPLMKG